MFFHVDESDFILIIFKECSHLYKIGLNLYDICVLLSQTPLIRPNCTLHKPQTWLYMNKSIFCLPETTLRDPLEGH